MLYAKLIGRIALFTSENIAHIEFYLQGLLPKILAIYTIKMAMAPSVAHILKKYLCVSFSLVIENIVALYSDHIFCCSQPRARSFYSSFIMPGHYKKILTSQQPIRAHVLLQPYNKRPSCWRCLKTSLVGIKSVLTFSLLSFSNKKRITLLSCSPESHISSYS